MLDSLSITKGDSRDSLIVASAISRRWRTAGSLAMQEPVGTFTMSGRPVRGIAERRGQTSLPLNWTPQAIDCRIWPKDWAQLQCGFCLHTLLVLMAVHAAPVVPDPFFALHFPDVSLDVISICASVIPSLPKVFPSHFASSAGIFPAVSCA